jgi:uncharacterized protein YjbJ (UPF0337 family)
MRRDEFEKNWNQFKGKIQQKWSKFTQDELSKIHGKYDYFLGLLQKKYGFSREQAEREIQNWQTGSQNKGGGFRNREESYSRSEEEPQDTESFNQETENPDYWKTGEKNKNNKKNQPGQDFKNKKRKAG